jgi:hemerythrin superfamily protein
MARKSKAAPDALHLLKKDHAEVSSLFTRYEDAIDRGEKAGIADEICRKLTIHSLCEEELLYPAAHASIDDDLVYEAEVEHQSVKDLVARIEDSDPAAENFDALVHVLCEYVRHHVREEESEMFPQLKRSDLDLAALGLEIAERRRELEAALGPGDEDDDVEEDEELDEDYDDDDDSDEDFDDDDADLDEDEETERNRDRAA